MEYLFIYLLQVAGFISVVAVASMILSLLLFITMIQKPSDYRTDERNEQIKIKVEKMKEIRQKNINSEII